MKQLKITFLSILFAASLGTAAPTIANAASVNGSWNGSGYHIYIYGGSSKKIVLHGHKIALKKVGKNTWKLKPNNYSQPFNIIYSNINKVSIGDWFHGYTSLHR